jgi:Tfp pilus assembly protein PilV
MTRIERTRPGGEAGFSLVEGMIAALILLFVILGVLPLVSQSMLNNLQGNDASAQTSASADGTERMLSVPFNAPELTVAAGSTSLVNEEVYALDANVWAPAATFATDFPGDVAQFTRRATIEQFNALEFDDDDTTLDTPLDGSTDPGFVHIKRITMEIQNERMFVFGGSSGSYRIVTLHTY